MRHPSPLQPGHQGAQRAARELARLDAGGDCPTMGGHVGAPCVVPLRSFPPHPGGTIQAADGAPLVWLAPLLGWARRGERRHAWVCVAGAAVLFGIVMGA